MFKKFREIKFNNYVVVLFVVMVLFLLLNLLINEGEEEGFEQRDQTVQRFNEEENQEVNLGGPKEISPEEYGKFVELLKTLPYSGEGFKVDAFNLYEKEELLLHVKIFASSGRNNFTNWLEGFDYDINPNFYIEDLSPDIGNVTPDEYGQI